MRPTYSLIIATSIVLVPLLACGNRPAEKKSAPTSAAAVRPAAASTKTELRLPENVTGPYQLPSSEQAGDVDARLLLWIGGDQVALGQLDAITAHQPEALATVPLDELADQVYAISHQGEPTGKVGAPATSNRDSGDGAEDTQGQDQSGADLHKADSDQGAVEIRTPDHDEHNGIKWADPSLRGPFITGTATFDPDSDERTVRGPKMGSARTVSAMSDFGPDLATCSIGDNAPLVMVDRNTKATRVATIVDSLCEYGARFAVSQGLETRQHSVLLGRLCRKDQCGPSPSAHRDLGDAAQGDAEPLLLRWTDQGLRAEFGTTRRDIRLAQLTDTIRELTGGRPTSLELVVGDQNATTADLIGILDAAAIAGLHSVYLALPQHLTASPWGNFRLGPCDHSRPRRRAVSPMVRIGRDQAVTGQLDQSVIRRFLRRQLPRIQRCYEKRVAVDPKLAGTVVVDFEIDRAGRVTSVDAEGVDPAVSNCVAKQVQAIRFPKPRDNGTAKARYSFHCALR